MLLQAPEQQIRTPMIRLKNNRSTVQSLGAKKKHRIIHHLSTSPEAFRRCWGQLAIPALFKQAPFAKLCGFPNLSNGCHPFDPGTASEITSFSISSNSVTLSLQMVRFRSAILSKVARSFKIHQHILRCFDFQLSRNVSCLGPTSNRSHDQQDQHEPPAIQHHVIC